MKNYLNFETDIKNFEVEIERLKDPNNQGEIFKKKIFRTITDKS